MYTWGLNLQKPNSTTLKGQMFYYNSATKEKKNSKAIPEDGVFLNHSNDSCYIELRFFSDQEEGFDHVIFSLKDKWRGTYLVSIEKVSN